MMEIVGPAGFERFSGEACEPLTAGPPRSDQGADLAERYRLQFGERARLPSSSGAIA